MYLLNVRYEYKYYILYVWKQKHFVQKKKRKKFQKKKAFFSSIAAKGLVWMLQVYLEWLLAWIGRETAKKLWELLAWRGLDLWV